MGMHWVAKGIPPQKSYLVKTIYVMICPKDQFLEVITKHWTFKTTCMVPHSPQFYYSLLGGMTSFTA